MTLIDSSKALAKSIIYKSRLIAIDHTKRLMELGLFIDNPYVQANHHIYKNLAGYPHMYNEDMFFEEFDGSSKFIDRDTLINDGTLQARFTFDSPIYNELIIKYPNNSTYIKGLLFAGKYEVDDVVSLDDGTIMFYDEKYVEWNEVSLIINLESSLKSFLTRYTNPNFMSMDSNYVTGLMLTTEHFLINKIIELRLSKQNHPEAHSYFQITKVNSNMFVGTLTTYLTKESKLWLYRNIDDITYNVGKHDNIRYVVEKLIVPSGYRVGYIKSNNMQIEEYEYLNGRRGVKNLEPFTIINIVDDKLMNTISLDRIYRSLKNIYGYKLHKDIFRLDKIKSVLTRDYDEYTKYLYMDRNISKIPNIVRSEDIVLSTLIRMLIYKKTSSYTIEIKGLTHTMSSQDWLSFVLYSIYRIKGRNLTDVSSIVNNSFIELDETIPEDILYSIDALNVDDDDIMTPLIDELKTRQNLYLSEISTNDEILKYVDQQSLLFNRLTIYLSSINNAVHKGAWKNVIGRLIDISSLDISFLLNTDFKSVVLSSSIDVTFLPEKEDWYDALEEVVKEVTGLTLKKEDEEVERLSLQSELVNRLSSYTTTLIYEKPRNTYFLRGVDSTLAYDSGIIKVNGVNYDCLGAVVDVYAVGDDSSLPIMYINTPTLEITTTNPSTIIYAKQTNDNEINILNTAPLEIIVY